ncbi:MAG: alpha/beta fold hydrolase, partial [Gaiellaceae bacterium]
GMVPAELLGYSLGGPIALRLAAERPSSVSAIALVASAGIVSTTRRAKLWLAATGALRPARKVAHVREVVARRPNLRVVVFGFWGAEEPRALPPEAVLGFLEAQREHTDVWGASRALVRDDPREYVHRVSCPVLVVWGARDRLTPLEDGFGLARGLAASLRVLPAAGHLLVAEYPEECAELLLDFLDRVR